MFNVLLLTLVSGIFTAVRGQAAAAMIQALELTAECAMLKCQPGFKALPPAFIKAVVNCTLNPNVTTDMCLKTCVFRVMGVISDDKAHEDNKGLDLGQVDIHAMETFKMATHEGRKSYYRISNVVRTCADAFKEHHGRQFAKTYGQDQECSQGTNFFQCVTHSFKCPQPPNPVEANSLRPNN